MSAIGNMGSMLKKAPKLMQMQKKIKSLKAAGTSKSGNSAILINGSMDLQNVDVKDLLVDAGVDEKQAESLQSKIESEVLEAYKDAKKQMEKDLQSQMDELGIDQDSIGQMLG